MKFILKRDAEFLKAHAVSTGEELLESVCVEVDPRDIPEDLRPLFVAFDGRFFATCNRISYKNDFVPYVSPSCCDYGHRTLTWNSTQVPSTPDVIECVRTTLTSIAERKAEVEAEVAAREAQRIALAVTWAALPLPYRAAADGVCYCVPLDSTRDYAGQLYTSGGARYDRRDLRELQPAAYAEAEAECDRLRDAGEIERLREIKRWWDALPEDAQRCAQKRCQE